jgi:hypothetical protein
MVAKMLSEGSRSAAVSEKFFGLLCHILIALLSATKRGSVFCTFDLSPQEDHFSKYLLVRLKTCDKTLIFLVLPSYLMSMSISLCGKVKRYSSSISRRSVIVDDLAEKLCMVDG